MLLASKNQAIILNIFPQQYQSMSMRLLFFFMSTLPLLAASPLIQPGKPHSPYSPPYIEIYAHRGARGLAPENTLPAYQRGLALGVDWVDMDLGITRDGALIVYHDFFLNPDILRKNDVFWAYSKEDFLRQLTDAPGGLDQNMEPYLIKNLNVEDLGDYDAGRLNPLSPYASLFPRQEGADGIKIPSLEEVVTMVDTTSMKHVFFQMEIKIDPTHPSWTVSGEQFIRTLDLFLRHHQLTDRVEIQSLDWGVLEKLHELNADLKLAFLITKENRAKMDDPNPAEAGRWTGGHLLKDHGGSPLQMIKDLGGSCYEPQDSELTQAQLREAHQLGLKVVVWPWPEVTHSGFDPKLINKLIDWGVDGIITDDPDKLRECLQQHGMPLPRSY